MTHPELERLEPSSGSSRDQAEANLHMGRIVPLYSLTATVSQRWLRRLVWTVLHQHAESLREELPVAIRQRRNLQPLAWSIQQIHFPESWESLEAARRRLAFEELFRMQLVLALRRVRFTSRDKPQRYHVEGTLIAAFRRQLPFALTESQRMALDELLRDLSHPRPMLRLLQGDVGCGKTVVAACLMAVAVQSGYQVAVMVPTELLAEQHARVLRGWFEPLGVTVRLVSQGVSVPERHRTVQEIGRGAVQIVVGTHALIEAPVAFATLSLVVIDEQHKFGVVQRSALARQATLPDVLVMTATPIPRTLALSIYGDLDASTITALPPGRLPVRTRWYHEAQRPEVYRLIHEELRQGRQGYIVYPLVEASDRQELKAATQMARHLQEAVFPDYQVALLHGQMRPKDKERVMQAFVEGRIHVVVSTVIVEVGLDVPNATVMLIEHPERFGLAQLHQLRGRIGRGPHPATCMVISDTPDEPAQQRLTAFVKTTDGFRLAEQDLHLRGPGELLGRRQHGWLRFRVADLIKDRALLDEARQEAFALVAQDPLLKGEGLSDLRQRVTTWRMQTR